MAERKIEAGTVSEPFDDGALALGVTQWAELPRRRQRPEQMVDQEPRGPRLSEDAERKVQKSCPLGGGDLWLHAHPRRLHDWDQPKHQRAWRAHGQARDVPGNERGHDVRDAALEELTRADAELLVELKQQRRRLIEGSDLRQARALDRGRQPDARGGRKLLLEPGETEGGRAPQCRIDDIQDEPTAETFHDEAG